VDVRVSCDYLKVGIDEAGRPFLRPLADRVCHLWINGVAGCDEASRTRLADPLVRWSDVPPQCRCPKCDAQQF
jgi:hypothetical protein